MHPTLQLIIVALCVCLAVFVLLRRVWRLWQAGQRSDAKLSGCGSGCSACPSAADPSHSHVTSPPLQGNFVPLDQLTVAAALRDAQPKP